MSNQNPTNGSDKAATDSRYEIERPELADARWIDDVCIAHNMMIAQDGNILYFLGGLQFTTSRLFLSSSHMYIMDLTAPIDLSSDHTSFVKVRRIPDHVPRIKWGNMFVQNNTLRLFGGMHEYYPIFNANGSRSYEERVPIANKLWTYNIKEDKWDNGEASSKVGMDTVGRALIAWDRKDGANGEGWMYGGTVETGDWFVGKNETGTNKKLKDLKGFLKVTGVEESQTWGLERLNDNEQQVGAAEQGDLLLLEEVGEKGVLVMVGGRSSNALKSLKEIQVYDIASSTWYTQLTTADKGNYPHERQEACAVVVSAPDKSSHNIYVYSGWAIPGQTPFSDLYILTLPAFHWVYVGTGTELPKVCHKCGVVNERYMVSFRGLGAPEDGL
ncbi:hypothetical protein BDZ91DRAFT_464286 [Kalaharituber pfeilii]|nr:hypothetical protein BDZ91DRAFT_464286 [Kalaharituber pfeilii]